MATTRSLDTLAIGACMYIIDARWMGGLYLHDGESTMVIDLA